MKTRFWLLLAVVFGCGINGPVAGYNADITNCYPVAGGFTLEWVPAGEAVVKYSLDLATPFTDLSVTLPAGQGSYTDSVHGNDAQCFYRVELLSPEGMVLIPGGTNSGTNYSITVSTFYMDATEVTKAQWDTVYNWGLAHDYGFGYVGWGKASNHPVHTVNWYDCVKWCNARSEMDGRTPCYTVGTNVYKTGQSDPDCSFEANGYRLPTSDEWEYAARGGLSNRRFPWGDIITHSDANYYSDEQYSYDTSTTRGYHPLYNDGLDPYTSPAGSFSANGYGLYDMTGNVYEWCNDPANEGSARVIRGGCWELRAVFAGCGSSGWGNPGYGNPDNGFRSVCR